MEEKVASRQQVKESKGRSRGLEKRYLSEWVGEQLALVQQRVEPCLRRHFHSIPEAIADSVRVDVEDLLQEAMLSLLNHPVYRRRVFTLDDVCGLYGKAIALCCLRVATKQRRRNAWWSGAARCGWTCSGDVGLDVS